jgi:hypothetical protein
VAVDVGCTVGATEGEAEGCEDVAVGAGGVGEGVAVGTGEVAGDAVS